MEGKHFMLVLLALSLAASGWYFQPRHSLSQIQSEIPDSVVEAFTRWTASYKRKYATPSENLHRLQIFYKNYLWVEQHNSGSGKSFTMKLNDFADLSEEEYSARFSIPKVSSLARSHQQLNSKVEQQEHGLSQLPEVDWRNKLPMNTVIPSATCNNGYAWVTLLSTQTNNYISYGFSKNLLSVQEVVDCSFANGNLGCQGGYFDYGVTYVRNEGVSFNSSYPYTGTQGPCRPSGSKNYLISGITPISKFNNTNFMLELRKGTIGAYMDLGAARFYSYGIFNGPCTANPDQVVLVVGAGTDRMTEEKFWIVMSTYGQGWGELGYMRLTRYTEDGQEIYSSCGLTKFASRPFY